MGTAMKPYVVYLVVDVLVDVISSLYPVRSHHSDFASKEAPPWIRSVSSEVRRS